MESAGAPAKLVTPDARGVTPRTRLLKLIDSTDSPALWISGPPGSGKTTLASSYLMAREAAHAWYRLDEGDAEPASFFHFLSQLALLLQPADTPPLPPLTPDRLPGLAAYARAAFRALYAHIARPLLLVFDDFHVLPAAAPTGELLRIAIEELPAGSRILILSREPPPTLLAGLELYGRMATLGWPELQFDEREARQLVQAIHGAALDETVFRSLQHQAGGWVSGWILLLHLLDRDPAINGGNGLSRPAPQIIFDFFSSELFERQPAESQRFLMETAFLPYLTGGTARQLTGNEDSEALLMQFLGGHFMVRKSSNGADSFEYHELYREFLQQQAMKLLGREIVNRLKHRVAEVLEAHGRTEEAISLYAELGDWPVMVRLAHERIPVLVAQGRTAIVHRWLAQLPAEILDTCPWLSYWWGISSFPVAMEQAREHLEMAYHGFVDREDENGMLLAAAGIIDVLTFGMTDVKPVSDWLRRILRIVPLPDRLPEGIVGASVACAVLSGCTQRDPGHPDIERWRDAAIALTGQSGDPLLQARTLYQAIFNACMRGETDAVDRYRQRLQALGETQQAIPAVVILASLAEIFVHIFHAEWDAVLVSVAKGLELAAHSDVHFLDAMLAGNGVVAAVYSGRADLVDTYSGQLSATLELQRPWDRACSEWALGLAAYGRGDYQQALEHGWQGLEPVKSVGAVYPLFWSRNLVIQALCALERYTEAWEHLLENESAIDRPGYVYLAQEHLFLKSYLLSVSGRLAEAVTQLKDVWKQWVSSGQSNFYSLQPRVIRHLGMLALANGIEPRTVKFWLDRFGLEPEGNTSALDSWPWPLKIYTLGRFSIVREGAPVQFSGKAQKKPLELLKALIALGGRGVAQERLAEVLWPDAEGDAARRSFSTTLYRLRKLLGDERLISVSDNTVTLDPRYCWVDAWAFERALGDGRNGSAESLLLAITLYKGHFMGNNSAELWVLRPRERLRTRYVGAVRDVICTLCEHDRCAEACRVAEQGLAIDDLVEDFYVALMACHRIQGRHGDALNAYRRCEQRLHGSLGVGPSPHTRQLRDSILGEMQANS